MSEKRFYLGNNDTTICDRSQGGSDGFNMLTIFKVVDLLNEQQDFIYQLQNLCGKSDYENAKLRIENKKLKDDLHNCRLNKNIIREKLKLWQDVHKEHNIYSIKDFEKLMKNVKQKQ